MHEQRSSPRILFQKQFGHLFNIIWSDFHCSDRIFSILSANLPEVEIETDMRMWATGMLDIIDIERLIVSQHISFANLIPWLEPDKIAILFFGEPLLPSVMYSLDHRARSSRCFQKVRYGTSMTKWIHRPTRLRNDVQIRFQPLMTCSQKNINQVN